MNQRNDAPVDENIIGSTSESFRAAFYQMALMFAAK